MIANLPATQYRLTLKFLLVLICYLFVYSYGRAEELFSAKSAANIQKDTVPSNEVKNLNWDKVKRVVAVNGILKLQIENSQDLIVRREDYERYARENKLAETDEKTFTKVEIEPEFPGGPAAWAAFVQKNSQLPKGTTDKTGGVILHFIVENDGSVHDVEVVAGAPSTALRNEAARLVKSSGKWNPAIQNFRLVRAYKTQSVNFMPEQ